MTNLMATKNALQETRKIQHPYGNRPTTQDPCEADGIGEVRVVGNFGLPLGASSRL
jgi:hypothetical protein